MATALVRSIQVEVEKALGSRLFLVSVLLFAGYSALMYLAFETLFERTIQSQGRERSGSMYLYICVSLSYYPLFASLAIIWGGSSISSEVRAGTLRYSLIAPISRLEFLLAKIVGLAVSLSSVLLGLYLVSFVIGYLFLGGGTCYTIFPLAPGRAQNVFAEGEILIRLALAFPCMILGSIAFASVALFCSTLIDNPVVSVTIPLFAFYVSWIVQFSPFLDWMKPYLITRHLYYWDYLFARQVDTAAIWQGVGFYGVCTVFFSVAAAVAFMTRDVRG